MTVMHHFLKNRDLKSEINVIPLLDILLVLLLITMITASCASQRIEIDLPNSSQSKAENINQEDQTVIIEVPETGQYNIVIDNNRVNHLSSEEITAEIQNRVQLNPKITFLIGGAKNVPYYEIIKVLDLLHSKDVKLVSLMTQPI